MAHIKNGELVDDLGNVFKICDKVCVLQTYSSIHHGSCFGRDYCDRKREPCKIRPRYGVIVGFTYKANKWKYCYGEEDGPMAYAYDVEKAPMIEVKFWPTRKSVFVPPDGLYVANDSPYFKLGERGGGVDNVNEN